MVKKLPKLDGINKNKLQVHDDQHTSNRVNLKTSTQKYIMG